jgi:hypothetical protein
MIESCTKCQYAQKGMLEFHCSKCIQNNIDYFTPIGTLRVWHEEDLDMYRNIFLISTCPHCGITAILRNRDNIVLRDCKCNGKSNPWKPLPDGLLVTWEELPV